METKQQIETLMMKIDELIQHRQIQQFSIDALEKRVSLLEKQLIASPQAQSASSKEKEKMYRAGLKKLSTRQHVIAQLMCELPTFGAVADRIGISENTVKSQVQTIYKYLDLRGKPSFIMWMHNAMSEVSEGQYKLLSGGLPQNWAVEYAQADRSIDPYSHLYAATKRRADNESEQDN